MQTFIKAVKAIFIARLKEFYRDKAAFYWHLVLPFFIIASFYFIFDSDQTPSYKVGVVGESLNDSEEFFQLKYIQFIPQEKDIALDKIRNHTLDMLVQPGQPLQYWVNDSNRKAYFLEKILKGSYNKSIEKNPSLSRTISYVDWVFPGILALNIMFSCLWGVGWLIVKYRDDGYLKRLNATPLKVYHFILGQMLARLIIILCGTSVIFIVGAWFIDFEMQGSYLDLFICYLFGVLSLISIGLLVATRTTSKEFADGALNLFSWPMIIFSGIWFSLEGAPSWLLAFAYSLPLTHLVESTRKIMLEGAMLSELWFNVSAMVIFSVTAFALVAVLFKWNER
ncbi:MAG: ABC transporter permease [Bdellovibrionales bacterium]|nr:ABC transporter permease [Bdellovibrionales bacterium]